MSHFNLNDLVFISTVCKRLQYNAQRLFPHRLKLWKDISDVDDDTSRFLLSKIGPLLTEIEIHPSTNSSIEETIDLLRLNCRHLTSILLHHSVPSDLSILPLNIKNISIQFPRCWTYTVDYLEALEKFKNLEALTLKFTNLTQIDSGFLIKLPRLKQLRLKYCSLEALDLDLPMLLDNSKTTLESLALSRCFPHLPDILNESIDRLDQLNELEFHFHCGPAVFIRSLSIIKRLTSIKLTHTNTSIDVDQLFSVLIEHNKIRTLSMTSIDHGSKSLNRVTLQQLHRLTNLRRLHLHETDFVTDDFLMEIMKIKSLTHFTYKQTYQPMLSFEAVLAVIGGLNGSKLEAFNYVVYHDVISRVHHQNNTERKLELLNACRKTDAFKRVRECKTNISNQLTSIEFLYKLNQKK